MQIISSNQKFRVLDCFKYLNLANDGLKPNLGDVITIVSVLQKKTPAQQLQVKIADSRSNKSIWGIACYAKSFTLTNDSGAWVELEKI